VLLRQEERGNPKKREDMKPSNAAQECYQRTISHNAAWRKMPIKYGVEQASCEVNSLPWKSRLAAIGVAMERINERIQKALPDAKNHIVRFKAFDQRFGMGEMIGNRVGRLG
jgi:hypothetical protein